MNMVLGVAPVSIKTLDLSDRMSCERVDAFVGAHPQSTPFHLTAWSRAIEKACGAKALYLVAEGADGIRAILPAHELPSAMGGRLLVSAGFAVSGGLLGDWMPLVGALLSLAIQRKALMVQIRGGPDLPGGWDVDETTFVTFSRGLAADDAQELAAIPRKRRAEIRRALNMDFVARVGCGPQDLADHFRVYSESVRNLGTPVFPPALFSEVLSEFGDAADILTLCKNGRPIASVLSLYHRGTAYPYWGGGTAAARQCHANALLYYTLMCHARSSKGCHWFDFGRSRRGAGPAAFKKGFGFAAQPLPYALRAVRAPKDSWMWDYKFPMARACWRQLPLPIANAVGPLISRVLG